MHSKHSITRSEFLNNAQYTFLKSVEFRLNLPNYLNS